MNAKKGNSLFNNNKQGSSIPDEPLYLAVGKLRRPHGVKGEILMEVLSDFPERIVQGKHVFIGERYTELVIDNARPHARGLIVSIQNVHDRTQAENFRNEVVYISSSDVITLPEDTYYHHQLIGLEVRTENNDYIGTISEILVTGANDVYLLSTPEGKEVLIPAIKSVVLNIDLKMGKIIVDLPEWL